MNRSVLLVTAVLASLFVCLFGWRWARTAPAGEFSMPPTAVAAMIIRQEAIPAALETVGTLQAVREVMLAPETAGRVVAIRFEAGGRVEQGAPIIELFDAPERADRAAAQARADLARAQLNRSRELASKGAESHQLLEQRQAELDQALASVQQLDARIAQKVVRAPFAGDLGIRRVNPGQYVNAGDPLASLSAIDRLYVNFTVPQQELAKIRVDGVVEVSVDAWPGRAFAARINAVEPVIGADTRNVTVQAVLPNPDRLLRPGMYVTARLVLPPEQNAIAVPATAIQTSASGESVVLVRGPSSSSEGTAEIAPVQTGRRIGERVVVTKGLSAGDVVVSEGQLRVQHGAKVKVTRLIAQKDA
jgi:membrane fusion protein, multidrug efflux system